MSLESNVSIAVHSEDFRWVLVRQGVDLLPPGLKIIRLSYRWDLLYAAIRKFVAFNACDITRHKYIKSTPDDPEV